MRVFCPSCQEPVTIADDLAGKATFCPLCKAAFTAPTLFSPPPAPVAPGPTPSAPISPDPNFSLDPQVNIPPPRVDVKIPPPAPDLPPRTPTPAGPARRFGFVIPPDVIQWIAPACLMLAVFLTFFSWNGAYPGDHDVYTQGPWFALTGAHSTDPVGEKVLKLDAPEGEGKKSLTELVHANLLMLPYILLLVLGTLLAIVFTVLPTLSIKLPPQIEKFMPWRMAIVAALCLVLVIVVGVQSLRGFGLENALLAPDEAAVAERNKLTTPEEIKKFEIRRESEIGKYHVRHTSALRLTMLCLVLAAVTSGLSLAMSRRGERPPPRVELMW